MRSLIATGPEISQLARGLWHSTVGLHHGRRVLMMRCTVLISTTRMLLSAAGHRCQLRAQVGRRCFCRVPCRPASVRCPARASRSTCAHESLSINDPVALQDGRQALQLVQLLRLPWRPRGRRHGSEPARQRLALWRPRRPDLRLDRPRPLQRYALRGEPKSRKNRYGSWCLHQVDAHVPGT